MTKYLTDYFGKEKITILGHSWGTYFGCNLVLAYPEYYDCYIGTGQLVDMYQNEIAFKEAAAEWAGDDEEGLELLESIMPDNFYTLKHFTARNRLMKKYGYDMMVDGTDYNMAVTEIFNPYYNINGDRDYQTNYKLAQEYFDEINAPYKKLYIMEDTTHGLLESKSAAFSEILHEIAKEQSFS